MKKILSLIVLATLVFVISTSVEAATFITKTGSFKILIVDDPNYDDNGDIKNGKSPVILYQVDISNASKDYQKTIIFERPKTWQSNDYVLPLKDSNALIEEGTYTLTVRTVNVIEGVSYSRPPLVMHTIVFDRPEPTPVPTQTPTDTPTPEPTNTPEPTLTDTPEPTITPTETPLPLPDALLEDNFQFEDFSETDFNMSSLQLKNKAKRHSTFNRQFRF